MPLMIPVPGGGMVPHEAPMPPEPSSAGLRLAMLADTCPHAAGPCGCGSGPPRLCGHPDRPAEVRRPACLACVARAGWEAGVDSIE